MGELLNTTYFHIVFTVPHTLNPLFLSNDVVLYNLLMRCAWETLDQLARQPQWLGARPGMLAVLHTWGQKIDFHPHVHCVVPGGGVLPDGSWKPAQKDFFYSRSGHVDPIPGQVPCCAQTNETNGQPGILRQLSGSYR
jgi:hypothetical protein